MSLSNWLDLLAVVVALIAAGIAWDAKIKADKAIRRSNELSEESNKIQVRLLDVEKQRDELFDQLERTPNLSATKVSLHTRDHVFFLRLTLTNLSKHTIQIVKVSANSYEEGPIAESPCNIVIPSSETFEDEIEIQPVFYDHVETRYGRQTHEQRQYQAEWKIYEVHSVQLDYLYAPTGSTGHFISFYQDRSPIQTPLPPPPPGIEQVVDFDPSKVIRKPY